MLTILFDGVAYGMLLFVLACGLAVTLGLMNFINLAHGAFAMAGGYVTVLLMDRWACRSSPACRSPSWRRRRSGWCSSARSTSTCTAAAPRPGAVLDRPGVHGGGGDRLLRRLEPAATSSCPPGCRAGARSLGVSIGIYRSFLIVVCGALALAPAARADEDPLRQPPARRGRRPARGARARHQRRLRVRRRPSRSARASPAWAARSAPSCSASIPTSRSSS